MKSDMRVDTKRKSDVQLVASQENRKAQILKAAALVFKDKGYARSTLREIVNMVGITKPTLYHHFESKQDLLFQIIYPNLLKSIEEMSKIVEMEISPKEKLNLAFKSHFQFYEDYFPELMILLHEQTNLLPQKMERQVKLGKEKYISLWEQLLREGLSTKHLRKDLDPKIITWAAIGMCNWAYQWASPEGRLKFSQIADIFFRIFYEGVRPQEKVR